MKWPEEVRVSQIEPKNSAPEGFDQTARVARELKSMLSAGLTGTEIRAALWHPDCVFRDAKGRAFFGIDAIEADADETKARYKPVSRTFTDPIVGQTKIAMFINIHTQDRVTGEPVERHELAIFTVGDGKVVEEEFIEAPKP